MLDHTRPELRQLIRQTVEEERRQRQAPVQREYLSPREVEALTGISYKTLERYRANGTGPPWFRVGGVIRYPLQGVRDWIERGGDAQ
jgi:predicted DNA-binding transcriptional regulator AlpA